MVSHKVLRGCRITAAAFVVECGIFSPLNSYGRLFTGIQSDLNTTAVQAGWIGSIPWATSYMMSPLALVLENYIGYQLTAILGAVLSTGCYLLASYMTSFIGLFLTIGVLNGFAIGMFFHSALSVTFNYFSSAGRTRAAGVMGLGCAFGAVPLSIFYEKIVPLRGWRFALQMSAIFAAILAIPASFLIKPDDGHIRSNGVQIEKGEKEGLEKFEGAQKEPYKTDRDKLEFDRGEKETSTEAGSSTILKSWLGMFSTLRSWAIFAVILFPAMAYAVFWTSPVSYFESISLPEEDILLYVTILTLSDLLGRLALVSSAGVLPVRETGILLVSNFIMAAVSLAFVAVPYKPVLIVCNICIGVGRGWYNVLPYKAGVDLLELAEPGHALSLLMIALGIGFTVGTLPTGWYNILPYKAGVDLLELAEPGHALSLLMIALGIGFTVGTLAYQQGAIYDISGSYYYAFIFNAVLFLIGGTIQLCLHASRCVGRTKKTDDGLRFQMITERLITERETVL